MIGDQDKIAATYTMLALGLLGLAAACILRAQEQRHLARARQDQRYTDVLAALFEAEGTRDLALAQLAEEQRQPRFRGHPDGPPEVAE